MIDLKTIIQAHNDLIDEFGGSKGVRSPEGLEAAIARPYMTFDQQELYPLPENKAAAIFESIIINHPFIDGNKRTAYVLLRTFLIVSGLDIQATEFDKYEMTIAASQGHITIDDIREWIKKHLIKLDQ
ncbi:MAG: type II toxin-antitoxin system death-on-curing family toxin [Bacteroidetes bacterium]|nr:type II toxin-antitoxin system death-on-curing family toxin [Bacteroidota bacterium]